jgi:hypothetical protein
MDWVLILALLHSEVIASVGDEGIVLSEGVLVEEEIDALSGGELVPLVLGVYSGLAYL